MSNRKNELENSIKEVQDKIKALEQEKQSMQADIVAKRKERVTITNRIHDFRSKNKLDNIGEVETQIARIDKKSEELQKEVHTTREQQHNLIREKDGIIHEISVIDGQINKVLDVEKRE